MALAKIFIEDLLIEAILGVYDHERVTPQRVVVNLVLWVDISYAVVSDALADAVDYDKLTQQVTAWVQTSRCQLVERLVSELADLVLREHTAVSQVKVRVDKPDALPQTRTVGIALTRTRKKGRSTNHE